MKKRGPILAALPLLLMAAGCATPVTLDSWQKSVEEYVWREANGDPNCLREVTWASTQKGFAVIGDPLPQDSTDAVGVLLAHRPVRGQPRFIFLVGLVRAREVEDIRIAVLAAGNAEFRWTMGDADPAATEAYRSYREKTWREQSPGHDRPPPSYTAFPSLDDRFELAIDTDAIAVTHPRSGARWTLKLPSTRVAQLNE